MIDEIREHLEEIKTKYEGQVWTIWYISDVENLLSEIDRLKKQMEPIEDELCLCPLHFGDCEYCTGGKCTSPLV